MFPIIAAILLSVPVGTEPSLVHTPPLPAAVTAAPIRFTVVVMDSFGDQRLLGVVRRTVGAARRDLLIIKRSELTPEFLVALAKAMAESFARHGALPAQQVNMYFMRKHAWPAMTAAERQWATAVIRQVLQARAVAFGRLGMQPAVDTDFTGS